VRYDTWLFGYFTTLFQLYGSYSVQKDIEQ